MLLYPDKWAAQKHGMKQFCNQKDDSPVYLFSAKVGNQPFYTALTAKEAAKYKLSPKKAIDTIGDSKSAKELRTFIQSIKPDKKSRLARTATRSYLRYRRAEQKLEKMERSAQSAERPEVGSDSRTTAPSV